jgi:hypothetical protein
MLERDYNKLGFAGSNPAPSPGFVCLLIFDSSPDLLGNFLRRVVKWLRHEHLSLKILFHLAFKTQMLERDYILWLNDNISFVFVGFF